MADILFFVWIPLLCLRIFTCLVELQTSQTIGQLYSDTSPYEVSVFW